MRDTNQPTVQNRTASISQSYESVMSRCEQKGPANTLLKIPFGLLLLYTVLACTGFYFISALQLLVNYSTLLAHG